MKYDYGLINYIILFFMCTTFVFMDFVNKDKIDILEEQNQNITAEYNNLVNDYNNLLRLTKNLSNSQEELISIQQTQIDFLTQELNYCRNNSEIRILMSYQDPLELTGTFNNNYKEDCELDNIADSLRCVVTEVNKVFIYNSTNAEKKEDNKYRIKEDLLLSNGGVCRNWNKFYQDIAKQYGYKYKENLLEYKNFSHIFGVFYDETGYCLVDQTEIFCFKYGVE